MPTKRQVGKHKKDTYKPTFVMPSDERIRKENCRRNTAVFLLCLIAVALGVACIFSFCACSSEPVSKPKDTKDTFVHTTIDDLPYKWEFDASQDLQMPELPTGCEATAAATMCRMYGLPITKLQVANALPKTDNKEEFLTKFIGDPYSKSGWACASPCIASTLNELIPEESNLEAVAIRGEELDMADLPCVVWVTIDYEEPQLTDTFDDAFPLYHNAHAVVLLKTDTKYFTVCDPLQGEIQVLRRTFEDVYVACGMQTVQIINTNNERG